MNKLLPENSYLKEAKKAKFQPHVVIQILIFIAIFIVTQLIATIPVIIFTVIEVFQNSSGGYFGELQDVNRIIEESKMIRAVSLYSTVIVSILVIIYCRFIEKRSLRSMGFVKRNALKQYLLGALVGFLMFSVAVLFCFVTGTLQYEGVVLSGSLGWVIVFFIGFLFQGMEEEVLMRGYFMPSLTNRVSLVAAILINSILFGCLHLLNNGIKPLALLNLILFGVFASVYAVKTNNVWGVFAIHSIWNFVQGNFYGIAVSGIELDASVLKFSLTESGRLINGGTFGLEGGLGVTIVLVISIIVTFFIHYKPYNMEQNTD